MTDKASEQELWDKLRSELRKHSLDMDEGDPVILRQSPVETHGFTPLVTVLGENWWVSMRLPYEAVAEWDEVKIRAEIERVKRELKKDFGY